MATPRRRVLFSDGPRTDREPKRHDEPQYRFLDRVDRPWYEAVRVRLQAWMDEAPDEYAARLVGRFQSRRDRDSQSAFFELYLFVLFTRLGLRPLPDPPIPGARNRADFYLARDSESAFVEATVCFTGGTDSPEARRKAAVYAALDRTDSPNFFLWITHEQGSGPMPRLARVRGELENWLRTLDPDAVDLTPGSALPAIDIEVQSWRFRFEAIPKLARARGQPGIRPLGVFDSGEFQVVTTAEQVRSSLIDKADQTRGVDEPLLIAVDVVGDDVGEDAVEQALLGDVGVRVTSGDDIRRAPMLVRQPTGLWTEGRLGRRKRVSAVLTVPNLGYWNVHRVEPVVWVNPWAERRGAIFDELPFRRVEFDPEEGRRRDVQATRTAPDVLGLPPGWPGPGSPWEDE